MDPANQTNSENNETKLHFLDYWRIIRMRKTVILAVFLLVVATTTIVTVWMQESYSSKVRISVDKDNTDVDGIDFKPVQSGFDPFWIQTQFEKIKSQKVLDEVIRRLNLNESYSKKFSPEGKLRTEETRAILKKQVKVTQQRNTSLIEIEVFSTDKKEAADIANTIAEVYRATRSKTREDASLKGIETLRAQLKVKDDELLAFQKVVNEMRKTNNIPDLGDGSFMQGGTTLNTETMRRLEEVRVSAQADYVTYSALLQNVEKLSPSDLRKALVTAYPDNELSHLLEGLTVAEQKVVALLQDLGPENPDVKRAQAIHAKINEQVDEKIKGMLLGIKTRAEYQKARLDNIQAEVDLAKQRDIELAARYRPYFDAKRRLENLQRVRDALNLRIEQESLQVKLPTTSMVEILDQAEPGLRPVYPKKTLNIILGAVVGLIVGVGLAFFIEYLDTSVKTIDDVERALQAPVLGVIPQNVSSLLEEGPDSPHAEAYRVLRTNVLFSRKSDDMRTLTVISGGAGEGKSTTLFNLATIFAQNGHRVCVVDSDLRRPSIHKILHLSNSIGLTNYLLKQNTLEQVIQTTKLATLDFLPSGKLPSSSMGILSSVQMKELISELKRRYDFVFFDSPPIMGVSDASILASEVDMVLQVIQYRRYPQLMTIRAKQMIQKVGGNLLGIVLNNINMSQDENYYYYSGYYHDYYSKQDSDDSDTPTKKSDKKSLKEPAAKVEIKSKF
jgi:capsular exopolysaccharide synthesis family protein